MIIPASSGVPAGKRRCNKNVRLSREEDYCRLSDAGGGVFVAAAWNERSTMS
jgi:hypothetical protein